MFARFGSLCVLPWILFAQMSWDMSAVPVVAAASASYEVPPEINDRGQVFNQAAKRGARKALKRIRYAHSVPILVETVESLDDELINDAARRRAHSLGSEGIYILLASKGQDVAVVFGHNKAHGLLADPDRAAIREAFLGPLRAGNADRGLENGVRAIDTTLAKAAAAKPKSNAQDMVFPATILFSLMAVLLALQVGTHDEDRRKRRRRSVSPPRESVLQGGHSHGPGRALGRL
ncbi:uncharacterized protein SAMN05444166_7875 [Singulisphaera sp. GP187]|uniref:TPM domain-containing protein n=1 Tax=Singulisphaera sp. GP187 TaxID=1882752 RepID=UPI00092C6251|nr:TPM domain-containing protein [Singulisphaera sp. GP187]SIO65889.1 uncharacterized protein SAMN05444166_7875 [Singulisphaera sp. GP187]